jgi:hypothetical protein
MVAAIVSLPKPSGGSLCVHLLRSKLTIEKQTKERFMSDSIRRNSLQIKPLQLPRDDNLDIRQAILDGPILLTMLRLAWPTILVLVAQVAVGVAEIFYVSFLGTTALVACFN